MFSTSNSKMFAFGSSEPCCGPECFYCFAVCTTRIGSISRNKKIYSAFSPLIFRLELLHNAIENKVYNDLAIPHCIVFQERKTNWQARSYRRSQGGERQALLIEMIKGWQPSLSFIQFQFLLAFSRTRVINNNINVDDQRRDGNRSGRPADRVEILRQAGQAGWNTGQILLSCN